MACGNSIGQELLLYVVWDEKEDRFPRVKRNLGKGGSALSSLSMPWEPSISGSSLEIQIPRLQLRPRGKAFWEDMLRNVHENKTPRISKV